MAAAPGNQIRIDPQVAENSKETIETRRYLHQYPETCFEEFETAKYIADKLTELGMKVKTGVGRTGVVGLLEGQSLEPCIGLRADMDALPVVEATGLEFASKNVGRMHACGHDGHMAILLTVAKILAGKRDQLKGSVKFIFQPAEEQGGGAREMIKDEVLKYPAVQEIYGLHLWNYSPVGTVVAKMGPLMAASDRFSIDVKGEGGHGAVPEGTVDAVLVGANLVTALHTIVPRNVSPLDSAVLTVGTINGGFSGNIIADTCTLQGTARTYKDTTQDLIIKRMEDICRGIGETFGAKVTLDYRKQYPATVNISEDSVKKVTEAAEKVVGKCGIDCETRTMAAEDFSFFIREIPGCFFFVGSAPPGPEVYPHHKPTFTIDERSLDVGASVFVHIIESILCA